MQKICTTLFLTCFSIMMSHAQFHPTCDGERYLSQVFDGVIKTSEVKYGENSTVIGGNFQELFMDIYEPEGDDAEARPLIVFAHGGSFIGGNKSNMEFLCEDFAKRGFVTATIDYRLIDGFFFDSIRIVEVVVAAMSDMKASVRYFREDADTDNTYKIDPNLIFAGGISAGGLMASHLAYVDGEDDDIQAAIMDVITNNGGFEGNSSTNTQYSSNVMGVLNYSGSLKESKWVDANDPPLFSAHDDGDQIVTYGNGFSTAFPFGNYMEGSASMKAFADAAGVVNQLITIPNSDGHVSYFGENAGEYQDSVIQSSAVFLHDIFCDPVASADDIVLDLPRLAVFPNPTSAGVTLEISNTAANYNVSIISVTGQTVYEQRNILSKNVSVDAAILETGLYIVNVEFSDNRLPAIRQKLVVQR